MSNTDPTAAHPRNARPVLTSTFPTLTLANITSPENGLALHCRHCRRHTFAGKCPQKLGPVAAVVGAG